MFAAQFGTVEILKYLREKGFAFDLELCKKYSAISNVEYAGYKDG